MPKMIERLSARKVATLNTPGLHADGNGLYLQITTGHAKSWIFRYSIHGRTREMGLGSLRKVSLEEARRKAIEYGNQRDEGIDPIEERRRVRQQHLLERAKTMTFSMAVSEFLRDNRGEWKNAKHAAQWETSLATYAEPKLGNLAVQAIDTNLVLSVLRPIWSTKTETASRVRGRIEAVLDWCTVQAYRSGPNPARWRGHLDKVLGKKSKIRSVKHHAAMPYSEIGGFMAQLRERDSVSARALEFTILTVARTGETVGAHRAEINERERVWIIPAERMKAKKEHRVPLCDRAMEIVQVAGDGLLFPGAGGRPLSNMAMLELVRGMTDGKYTVHGFRSTFRDWAGECTNYPGEVAEMALAHSIKSKTEAAYRRGDLLEKRRKLLEAWGRFTLHSQQIVIPLSVGRRS